MKANRLNYLVTSILLIGSFAGAVYAQQTNPTITAVSDKPKPVDDDNEQTKPNAYQLFGHGDPKLDSLSKLMDHYSKLTYNYEHNKAYETAKIKAKGFSVETPAFYNNDTLRRIMASIDKISKDFKALDSRRLAMSRDSLGQLIGDYFKTQKFREINSKLQNEYHIDPAKNYAADNADYRRYHDELVKQMPGEINKDLRELKNLSEKFRDQLRNPLYVSGIKHIHIVIDSMKAYYKTPHTAQYTYASYEATMDVSPDERRKANNEVIAYMENPEWRSDIQKLSEFGKQMHDYYQSTPAAKVLEDAWRDELRTILADDYDTIVHPGRGLEYLYDN